MNKRSQAYKKCQIDVEDLTENELSEFLADKPRAIKRPILTDGKDIVLGFQEDDMVKMIEGQR